MAANVESLNKSECTGCAACADICPVGAIRMIADGEGFLYPSVDREKCVGCGLCKSKCPSVSRAARGYDTPECYAVMADSDELRMKSSSGGVFTLLAENVIDAGGYVCGAAYEDEYRTVRQIIVSDKKGLERLRGSKYVQSESAGSYAETKKLLDNGKSVLYSGCPCQIAGLKNFLSKEYDNLLTVDLVCHGGNSPKAYRAFLKDCAKGRKITSVNFREKEIYGWSTPVAINYSDGSVTRQPHDKSEWYIGFLNGITCRPYCGHCEYAGTHRVGDITLGDFWGIGKYKEQWDDRKGTSLVLINTKKGERAFKKIKSRLKLCEKAPLSHAQKFNGALRAPQAEHPGRRFFFKHLPEDGYLKSLWYGRKYRYDVGLVGWWFASNYGSALTYYGLGKILEDMDMLAIMVQVPKLDGRMWEPQTKKTVDFMKKFFPITKYRPVDKLSEVNRFCDMFMLGSDQLWTKGAIDLTGYTFFLDFAEADKKKVAFATSFGHEEFGGTTEQKKKARELLLDFDYISVRERSGISAAKENFGIEVNRDLDPVFICDKRHYDSLADKADIKEDGYLLCYILDPSEEKQKAISYAAKRLGLKVTAILDMKTEQRRKGEWHTGELKDDPTIEEFVSCFKHSRFVLTDSHHGACFAMIYEKPFAAFANYSRGITRFTHLLELAGLPERLLYDPSKLPERAELLTDIDYAPVREIFKRERAISLERLKGALSFGKERQPSLRSLALRVERLEKLVAEQQSEIDALKAKK